MQLSNINSNPAVFKGEVVLGRSLSRDFKSIINSIPLSKILKAYPADLYIRKGQEPSTVKMTMIALGEDGKGLNHINECSVRLKEEQSKTKSLRSNFLELLRKNIDSATSRALDYCMARMS